MFGDMQQLPPIPASSALFIPPANKKTMTAHEILDIFWSNKPDALNFLKELLRDLPKAKKQRLPILTNSNAATATK